MFARAAVLGDQGQGPEAGGATHQRSEGTRCCPGISFQASPLYPVELLLSGETPKGNARETENVFHSHEKMSWDYGPLETTLPLLFLSSSCPMSVWQEAHLQDCPSSPWAPSEHT